ncbi:hypothetical protein ABW20_dc0107269 [Dactylellina cionopaga]|nr:hypothetical protein ABW20_dc0107269 [Dactylellina cionopaga]
MVHTVSKSHWQEIAPGQWMRDYDGMEKLVRFLCCGAPTLQWPTAIGATLPGGSLDFEAIKNAWKTMRYLYPSIACSISNTGFSYKVPTANDLDEWLERTTHVDESHSSSGRDLSISLDPPEAAVVYFLPHKNEVFIQVRHELVDGIGAFTLFNNFLELLRQPRQDVKFGDEPTRLSPSLEQLTNTEIPSPEVVKQAEYLTQKYVTTPSIGLKTRPDIDITAPTVPRRLEQKFSKADTSRIIQACKEQGLTVTEAISAAAVQATLEHAEEDSGNLCTFWCINLREQLSAPYNGPQHAASLCFTAAAPVIPVSESRSFLAYAKEVNGLYTSWKSNKDNVASHTTMSRVVVDTMTMAAAAGITFPAIPIISSMGIVENRVTEPAEDVWFSIVFAASHVGLHLYTSGDCLRIIYSYSSMFHEDESINEFAGMTKGYLSKGLDLEIEM